MVRFRRQGISASFIDVVFNLLLGVTLMFFLALILMKPITEDKKIDSKAEFIVTAEWPTDINSDIDLWTLDPLNNAVGYAIKEAGVSTLERDDLGVGTDMYFNDETGKTIKIPENAEIITVRAIVEGEWAVNLFYYQSKEMPNPNGAGRGNDEARDPPEISKKLLNIPTEVTVTLIKVNPTYQVVMKKKVLLTYQGEEQTILRFDVEADGNIKLREPTFIRFVQNASDMYDSTGP